VIRLAALLLFSAIIASSQDQEEQKIEYSKEEARLLTKVRAISVLPEDKRSTEIREVALEIRRLPASANKVRLADAVAFLSTAGDQGPSTLQEVGDTLANALREKPGELYLAYLHLAQLVHYEHVKVSLDDPNLKAALSTLDAADQRRREINFTLPDLNGKSWTLKDLRGKVVLVNFWATWNRPSRQQIADSEGLYRFFKKQGLVVLGISSEKQETLAEFVKNQKITFPVLLDSDQKVTQLYNVTGLPRSFVYDRQGNLAAQAIDLRTQKQLLNILKTTGLQ
jgi:peroxiredoxin